MERTREKEPKPPREHAVSNLTSRVLVAITAVPLILLLTLAGGFYFFGFVAGVSLLALHEFYLLTRVRGADPNEPVGLLLGVCINAAFFHNKLAGMLQSGADAFAVPLSLPSMTQAFMIVVLLGVPLVLLCELFRNRGSAIVNIGATLTGVFAIPAFLGSLIGLRELFIPGEFPVYRFFPSPEPVVTEVVKDQLYRWGGLMVIAMFASVWLCDSAAYFAGRSIGKHRLFPRVSPHKTWEGAVAGFLAAITTFVAAKMFFDLRFLTLVDAIVCGTIVGTLGQLGDLVESLWKRDAGVKDSSGLIPGHGGVLDRFDSIIFLSPILFWYVDFVVCS